MKPEHEVICTKRYMNRLLDETQDELNLEDVEFIAITTCRDMVRRADEEGIALVNAQDQVRELIDFWRNKQKTEDDT